MGTAQIWTSSRRLYSFTHSTCMDSDLGVAQLHIDGQNLADLPRSFHKVPKDFALSLMIASLCNNAEVQKDNTGTAKSIGDPTEVSSPSMNV